MPHVHQVVYISAAKRQLSDAELADILAKARSKNASLAITGLLIHHAGSFLQVLEGPEARVEPLLRIIEADPRHRRVVVLARHQVARASFAEWSMGFVDRANESVSGLRGFKDLSSGALDAADLTEVKTSAFYLIEAFSVGRLRQSVSF